MTINREMFAVYTKYKKLIHAIYIVELLILEHLWYLQLNLSTVVSDRVLITKNFYFLSAGGG